MVVTDSVRFDFFKKLPYEIKTKQLNDSTSPCFKKNGVLLVCEIQV